MDSIDRINDEIIHCRLCPRLVAWREEVAITRKRAFVNEVYWGKPVPYFGDHQAERLIVGLAPAAHGANRTGRMFTGDRSGDFLYAALFRAGVASQPVSNFEGDGLRLFGAIIAATAHCAPPENKPLPVEIENCSTYLSRLLALRNWKAVLCLGGIAWNHVHRLSVALQNGPPPRSETMDKSAPRSPGEPPLLSELRKPDPRPAFGHGAVVRSNGRPTLIASYHPSQQNTFTGRLTPAMLDQVIAAWLNEP